MAYSTSSNKPLDDLLTELERKTKPTDVQKISIEDIDLALRRLVKLLESNAVVDSSNRQRVNVEAAVISSGTVTTVGTVTTATVSNAVALGGVDVRWLFMDTARNAYANGIRPNLTFA